ncbi:uncharacterized protein [Montipora capricornis]
MSMMTFASHKCKEILQTLMALRKSFKVHVTFGDSKRILTLNKGEGVPELRYNFLREFSEELSDEVPPTNIKFQRYNDTFNDHEDLKPDAKLTENAKLLANCTKINEKNMDFMRSQNPYCGQRSLELAVQQRENLDHQMAYCIALCGPLCFSSIPMYSILHGAQIKKGNYKLWNPVKNGVIMFETNKSSVLTIGQLGPTDAENTVTVQLYGQDLHYLCYTGSSDQYITAAASGTGISLESNSTEFARFEPIYNGSYTMFRCNSRSTGNTGMYLGCNEGSNNAVLVPVDEEYKTPGYYPDPRTLFITTKI